MTLEVVRLPLLVEKARLFPSLPHTITPLAAAESWFFLQSTARTDRQLCVVNWSDRKNRQTKQTPQRTFLLSLSFFLSPSRTRLQGLVKCTVQKKEGTEMQRQMTPEVICLVNPLPSQHSNRGRQSGRQAPPLLPGVTCQILITWSFGDPVQVG